MNKLNLFTILSLLILCISCNKDETVGPLSIQDRLTMERPIDIYNSGVPLKDLYGKLYEGGLIFHLNTTDGTGFVAAPSDQGAKNNLWGCQSTDLQGLSNVTDPPTNSETEETAMVGAGKANTNRIVSECSEDGIAAKLCADLNLGGHEDWFLPSRGELKQPLICLKKR